MKTIIVTDPCYILEDEEWSRLCDKYLASTAKESEDLDFAQAVQKDLESISGDTKAVVGETKVGDWVNRMAGEGVLEEQFAADSGLVCVVELTDGLSRYWEKYGSPVAPGCVARLEVPDNAFYELNFLGEKTKVNIWADEFKTLLAHSEE